MIYAVIVGGRDISRPYVDNQMDVVGHNHAIQNLSIPDMIRYSCYAIVGNFTQSAEVHFLITNFSKQFLLFISTYSHKIYAVALIVPTSTGGMSPR